MIGHLTAASNRAATFVVTNNASSGPGSLRAAVLAANASGTSSDTIVFTANVRGKIFSGSEMLAAKFPSGTLIIEGPGADVLSIEGNFASRVFRVQNGHLKISGLRISRGNGGTGFAFGGIVGGGGIFVVSGTSLTIESCAITENQGGGIETVSDSILTINNSLIAGNSGGGIDGAGGLSISNSTVSDNYDADNAGIRWLNGAVTLRNVTVSGNRGIDSGGININGATTVILNSTIAGNFGANGVAAHTGGLRIEDGTVSLKNTIVADNNGFTRDVNGTVVSQGNNLIRNTTGASGFIASDLLNVNPQLGGFANNGGATYTISLLSTSPAINAGNNAGAPATDQRGIARPQGSAADIGAYEKIASPAPFGKIAFVSDRNGNREIYSMNADATNQTRLTTNSATDEFPDWSPDGTKIAFSTNRNGNFEIYAMNADGSAPTRFTTNAVPDSEPAFSPDGAKIAFVRNGAGIFLMDADGANQTALPNAADGGSPSWSPDGTRIVFTCSNMGSAICKIDADGTNRTPFLFNDAIHFSPAWSPDGDSIAAAIDFDIDPFLYFYSPHNVEVFRPMLAPNEIVAFAPAFSPNGAKLAYNNLSETGGNLFIRDADGGNPVLLIDRTVSGNSSHADWFGFNTPATPNIFTVVSGTTSITYTSVTIQGTTTVVPINPFEYPPLYGCTSPCKLSGYDFRTTSTYTGPLTVCITVPSVTDPFEFARLRILHYENGVPVDATIRPPDSPAPNFATKTICARVTSLSPFIVAESLAPTAANVSVSGRVVSAFGSGIGKVRVSLTDSSGETRTVVTSTFGYFRFDEVQAGQTYIVGVRSKRYQFAEPDQVISVNDEIGDLVFTALPE